MLPIHRAWLVTGLLAAAPSTLTAENRHLVNDRTSDAIYKAVDADMDGDTDGADFLVWFSSANAAGTLAIDNPTALGVSNRGEVAMGDQGNRVVYFMRDTNCDGDAQDAGESIVYADASNASGVSFAFPTGCEFGPDGALHVANAGNSFGDDGIYRLEDLNGDGDAQDAGEITPFAAAGAFGPGNRPYGPQEFIFQNQDLMYVRNSSTNLHSIIRLEDLNSDGDADDPGEFTIFWDANNLAGTPATAGFAIDWDRARPGAIYTMQLASGGIDQLVRVQDMNGDDDAQDAGESAIVWSTAEDGFSSVDMICWENGDVLITDNSALDGTQHTIIRLHDGNDDGDFMDAGEQMIYFGNELGTLQAIRQLSPVRLLGDIDDDGVIGVFDLFMLLADWNLPNGPGDLDDSGVTDVFDLFLMLDNWNACL